MFLFWNVDGSLPCLGTYKFHAQSGKWKCTIRKGMWMLSAWSGKQFTGQSQRSGRFVHDSFAIFNWQIPYVIKLLGYPKIGVWIRLRVSIDLIRLIYASAISASLWLHWASNCDWCSVGWTLVQMLWFGEITAHYIRFWYRNDVYLGRRISQEIIFERNFWNSNRACYIEIFPEKYLIVFRSDAKSADQITEQHLRHISEFNY